MFCDMVGSTALSTRLDPEELRELLSEYHARVTEATARHGRFVARYMGDGVLAYFGWPTADESDAERAVRAGLAIIEAVRSTRSSARSRIRPGSRAMTRCRGNPRNLPPSWRRCSRPRKELGLLREMMSLPVPVGTPALGFSPQRKMEKVFAALCRWLECLAGARPVST
jgi:Adenylate and Guanylate cyclase catalytic domain